MSKNNIVAALYQCLVEVVDVHLASLKAAPKLANIQHSLCVCTFEVTKHAFQPSGEHLANKCFIIRVHAACQLLEEVYVVFLLNELDALRV